MLIGRWLPNTMKKEWEQQWKGNTDFLLLLLLLLLPYIVQLHHFEDSDTFSTHCVVFDIEWWTVDLTCVWCDIFTHEGSEDYSCLIIGQKDLIIIMQGLDVGEYVQLRNPPTPPCPTPHLYRIPHPPHTSPFVLQSFVRTCVRQCVCVRACVRARACVCVCVCVRVLLLIRVT